ncbi:MAG: DUF4476 domain-containing protein [Flavobacteriales bacterium]|nr:DUF4476 domain-containing protein [Flavobacteriales bacterium]
MRALYIIFLATFVLNVGAQNCKTPMSSSAFQKHFNAMFAESNDQSKFSYSGLFVQHNCFTSQQVLAFATVFSNDTYRLEFCKSAYQKTIDPVNFYDVYDTFSSFSSAFRLHDFVNGIHVTSTKPVATATSLQKPDVVVEFPSLNYPSYANYKGDSECDAPMAENDFISVAKELFYLTNDLEITVKAQEIADDNCLSMTQLMKIASRITLESKRLSTMKSMLFSTYDTENFASASVLFSHPQYQTQWTKYCETELQLIETAACATSDYEYLTMLATLDNEKDPEHRLTTAKQILNSNCLKVHQIKGLMEKFTFAKRQLVVVKAAYEKCLNQNSYYQLSNVFSYGSDKKTFNTWLEKQ